MRNRLMAAAAMAPMAFVCSQPAFAQTTISSNSSTPVTTASSGDITIASGVSLQPNTANTAAVTINSNNSVTNNGTIQTNNLNTVTGILAASGGPFTGNITNTSSISLTESYSPSDSANNDGVLEAPFADPNSTSRYAIRVQGPLTGAITNSGTITVQGNNSYGVSIENQLTGSFSNSGTITINGNNSVGVSTAGPASSPGHVTGNVQITGTISMKGQGSVALQTGQIDGKLSIYSALQTTGYATTTRATTAQALQNIQKTAADLQLGGPTVQIQGSVLGGVFLGAPPTGVVSTDTTTDADGDGIVDSAEKTSTLTSFGSAPALQIGGPSAITLGQFGTGTYTAYGLIVRGTVSGQGIFDGKSAAGADIGVGGAGVNIQGGILVVGSVNATAFQAGATAFHIESGVTTPQLQVLLGASNIGVNLGNITSTVTTAGTDTATALQIDAGANVAALNNSGTISASVTGDAGSATAVVDNSGSISTVNNTGAITAKLNPTLAGETLTGNGLALDLHRNTTGVAFTQTGSGAVTGDVLLGSGANSVQLLGGAMTGTLNFSPIVSGVQTSAAAGALTIDNGAVYTGSLIYQNGAGLAVNVANGQLIDHSPTTINASSLNVGSASTLSFALDPRNNAGTLFNVSGAATIAAGAQFGATVVSVPSLSGQTFTVVQAGSLSLGAAPSALLTNLPYLFSGSIQTTAGGNGLQITIDTKTPAQMAMNKAEAAAFPAVYAALSQDSGVQTAILGASTRQALISSYDQLLPNSSGDVFETARGMSRAVSRATADRFDLPRSLDLDDEDDGVRSGFWAGEFYSGIEQRKVENNAYHSAALGVVGGYDFGGTGFAIAAGSSNITRPGAQGDNLNSVSLAEASVYASPRFGALSVDARVGAGYLTVSNRRQLVVSVMTGDLSQAQTISRTADGRWSGFDLTAHLGAALQWDVSKHLFFQPRIYGDVFHLQENAYHERNGSVGYDFNVSQRTGTQTNGAVSLVTGLKFGSGFVFSPQLEVGYDDVIQGGPGATTARFAYGGPSFTTPANRIGGAGMARLTLKGDGEYVHFNLQAGGEYNNSYRSLDLKAVFRMTF